MEKTKGHDTMITTKQQTHTHAYTCNTCQTSYSLHAITGYESMSPICPSCGVAMEDYTLHRDVWPKPVFVKSGDVVQDCVRLLREWDAAATIPAGQWMDSHVLDWWWVISHQEGFAVTHRGITYTLPLDSIVVWHGDHKEPCLVVHADGSVTAPTAEQQKQTPLVGFRNMLAFVNGYAPITES
jgi:hypothetical protein